ncbi:hypothetical protein ACT3SZ_15525 [Corynebacterium sp. AOP40-9SA-29]|uniref:hypothetical protein n=1 Tax=Corynebacterium sp. AOP40-9SA-29 TaxID=3457677 RepID=UPI0040335E01
MTHLLPKPNPYARDWTIFAAATKNHELTILHDDGLYRHCRMAQPGTGIWSWNIITWPGHLAITGDIGDGWTFSRLADMFDFFGPCTYGYYDDQSPFINVGYWAEKLGQAQRTAWKKYDDEEFLRIVRECVAEKVKEGDLTPLEAREFVEDAEMNALSEDMAISWGTDHPAAVGTDFWETDLHRPDTHFIYALYAIVTTITAYRATTTPTARRAGSGDVPANFFRDR